MLGCEPKNWMLTDEVARFLTFSLQEPAAGLDMSRAGSCADRTRTPICGTLPGTHSFCLGRVDEAADAFLRCAGRLTPTMCARYNLVCVYAYRNESAAALATIAEGLSIHEAARIATVSSKAGRSAGTARPAPPAGEASHVQPRAEAGRLERKRRART